jgi:hypothetical protein
VRRASELRAEAAITGKPRPLYFTSTRLDDALAAYLRERIEQGLGLAASGDYRGLDPRSCLFLSPGLDSASPSSRMARKGSAATCAGPSWRLIASCFAMPTCAT